LKFALLAWGSLVWNPGELKITGDWKKDGPCLPIEFARKSGDGRLTLVLFPGAKKVKTLWAFAKSRDLQEVICNLARREGTTTNNIGYVSITDGQKTKKDEVHVLPIIESWAKQKQLNAVVWTNLPPKFEGDLTPENVLTYLKGLDASDAHNAEVYVRNAPRQIRTEIRSRIENELGWTHSDIKKERDWTELKKDLGNRVIHKTKDNSIWAVVPNRPAAFGHLIIISWKSRREHDITDEGLFIDGNHMQDMMQIMHNLAFEMKTHLTSNGEITGKKCKRVYAISECETKNFPFHFHLIPRFSHESQGHLFLFQKELEEARWMTEGEAEPMIASDGNNRIRKAKVVLKHHKALLRSKKWVKHNRERQEFIGNIVDWWKSPKIAITLRQKG